MEVAGLLYQAIPSLSEGLSTVQVFFTEVIFSLAAVEDRTIPRTLTTIVPTNMFSIDAMRLAIIAAFYLAPLIVATPSIAIPRETNVEATDRLIFASTIAEFIKINTKRINENFRKDMYHQCDSERSGHISKMVAAIYYEAVRAFGNMQAVRNVKEIREALRLLIALRGRQVRTGDIMATVF